MNDNGRPARNARANNVAVSLPNLVPEEMPAAAAVPAIVITLSFEDPRPRVRSTAQTDAEEERLEAWIDSQAELQRITFAAIRLERRAA